MVIGGVDYRNRIVFQDPEDLKDYIQYARCNLSPGIFPNGLEQDVQSYSQKVYVATSVVHGLEENIFLNE